MVVREENRGEEGKEASRERETERDRESTKDRERVRKCYGCCCCCCWRLQASSSPSSQCVQKELFSHHLLCGDGIMGIPLSLSLSNITKLPKTFCVFYLCSKCGKYLYYSQIIIMSWTLHKKKNAIDTIFFSSNFTLN